MVGDAIGSSDPLSYSCTCDATETGGAVLLFYRYWDNEPPLPSDDHRKAANSEELASFHRELTFRLGLGGKLRFASEGFNITVGGTSSSIAEYIRLCCDHWSFAGLKLNTQAARDAFFKPTSGCACVFSHRASVKVAAEITPLGITDYLPASWSSVIALSPKEFHALCNEGHPTLVDVRNHYESRIGYFVTGTGQAAVRPGIRRFSQWPGYVSRHMTKDNGGKKQILTYCTGGIRCEKGARWMHDILSSEPDNDDLQVFTLQGGIVAYLAWIQTEITEGRKNRAECLFKGRNYVFDARGSTGLDSADGESEKMAECHSCGIPEDRLGKCKTPWCHLVLVLCKECEHADGVACCEDCEHVGLKPVPGSARNLCRCETERERQLWGQSGHQLGRVKRIKGKIQDSQSQR